MEITLDKAINLQRKTTEKLIGIKNNIIKSDNEEEMDKLLDRYDELSNDLIKLKTAIRKANIANNISEDIYRRDALRLKEKIYRYIGKIAKAEETRKDSERIDRKIKVANYFIKISPNLKTFSNYE